MNRATALILTILMAIALTGLPLQTAAGDDENRDENQETTPVILHTSKGAIHVELFADKAPKSVENFLEYAREGHYDGTLFHRVIPDFMIQGGGFDEEFEQRETRDAIENEADNGLENERGTLAMARTNDPHSATAQFFINTSDNEFLNHTGTQSGRTWGYAVFGRVSEGMDVVDAIESVETTTQPPHRDVPAEPVIIERVELPDS